MLYEILEELWKKLDMIVFMLKDFYELFLKSKLFGSYQALRIN